MLNWDDFEGELRRLHELASNAGVDAVEAAGFRLKSPTDLEALPPKAMRIFLRGCHYGFALAQAAIGRLVLDIEAEGSEIRQRLINAKRERDRPVQQVCERQLATLKRQKQLLRRVLDEVLRQIVGKDTWALRRLDLYDEERNIDPTVLRSTLQEAWKRNKEDRMAFHLVTDLLTAVHVGDLIRIDKRAGAERKWSIIELKSGKVNDALNRLLDEAPPEAPNKQLEQMAISISPTGDKQVRRMTRQVTRQRRVEEIISTDKGTHPLYEVPIIQHDAPCDTEDYLDAIRSISEALNKREFAAISIQSCINLFGVRGSYLDKYGIGLVAHHFYHLAHTDAPCLLSATEAERVGELQSAAKIEFHDYWLSTSLLAGR